MRIYRLALPLPLDEIPIERGETMVDYTLTEDDIVELEQRFNIKQNLGSGEFGIAYLTEDNKVLKLTTDIEELNAAKDLINYKQGPFAEIYDFGEIKDNVYYILKEKVTPLTEEEKNLMYAVIEENSTDGFIDEDLTSNNDLIEKMEDYITEVQNYMQFVDSLNVENVGKDQYGDIVCYDVRHSNQY